MDKKIELTREQLTKILHAATGNVRDFVMHEQRFIDGQLSIHVATCPLPDFLYDDNGRILIGQHGDTITKLNSMKKGLKIFRVEFDGAYHVSNCLVLAARNQDEAEEMAKKTIAHTTDMVVNVMTINESQIIEYLSGEY